MSPVKLALFFLIGATLVLPRSVHSHDGWVEISPSLVEKNQVATIALIQGNHSNEHKSYRIAGKWDQKYTTLVVVDPKGKKISLTDQVIDFGEDAETIGPKGPKGFFLNRSCRKTKGSTTRWRARRAPCSKAMGPRSLRCASPKPPSQP